MQKEIALQTLVKTKHFKKIFREFDTQNKS